MRTPLQVVCSMLAIVICIGIWQPLIAQQPPTSTAELPSVLSGEEVVSRLIQRNLERARPSDTFQGTRVCRLECRGFPGSRTVEMILDVKYHSPATVEFNVRSATGSKLLIEKVFKKLLQTEKEELTPKDQGRLALNNENYSFTLGGQVLYRGRIWIDAEDFAVARIEAGPAENPSFWIKSTKFEQTYLKVADFWLHSSNRSSSNTRLGGSALLTIKYKDYRVTAIPTLGNSTGTDVPTKKSVLME